MPAHIAFITLFLGIVSGKQGIEVQADNNIASIRVTIAGLEIARLTKPPWRAEIDLGPELVPRELQAIGYDASGNEVARASQVLNLPQPVADVQIVLEGDGVQMRWSNLTYEKPKSAAVTFDGAPLRVDSNFHAPFPVYMDKSRPHVIEADLRFSSGVAARREAVLEGTRFSDTAQSEITPVLLTETAPQHPAALDECFTIDGAPVRLSAVEKEKAQVLFVQDPDPQQTRRAIDPTGRASNFATRGEMARLVHLDADTAAQIFFTVTKRYADPSSNAVSRLFEHSAEFPADKGVISLLTLPLTTAYDAPRQYSDAVAVAGIGSTSGGRRRAVVLILGSKADTSVSDPRAVRRYLQSIGVPLFVWSPGDVTLDAATRWGDIEDISNIDHLRAAVNRLRKALAAQRIAWVHADTFRALRAKADERCGFATVAH